MQLLFTKDELAITRSNLWDKDYLKSLKKFYGITKNQKILDAGCGTGFFTNIINNWACSSKITGIDIDAKLIKFAEKNKILINNNNLVYLKGDVYNLAFPDEFFDITTCHILLSNLINPNRALKEMIRVTKEGGVIIVIEPVNSSNIVYNGNPILNNKTYMVVNRHIPEAFERHAMKSGVDLSIGMKVPSLFLSNNLKEMKVKGYLSTTLACDYLTEKDKIKEIENDLKLLGYYRKKYIAPSLNKTVTFKKQDVIIMDYINSYKRMIENRSLLKKDGSIKALPLIITRGKK